MKYLYPQVHGGFRWNMLKRCLNEIGIEPVSSGDVGSETYLEFVRELSTQEKSLLDALMADNPTYPPTGTLRFKVVDLWEKLQQFNQSSGSNFKIYYNESVPGSGKIDSIELHSSSPLTTTQKSKVKTAYANLISEA